ncbi:MAG: hypothetical protein HYS09_03450 [Chloroflexi bacterium]|nr:hypothetical protein [Chloroflexota bacterium]
MPVEFIGREIEVKLSDDADKRPVAFKLRGKEHAVAEVLATWQDAAFGSVNPHARDWRTRQQRNYFRVRTKEGDVFEIYADWLSTRRQRKDQIQKSRWYAYRRITGAEVVEAAPAPPGDGEAAAGEEQPSEEEPV